MRLFVAVDLGPSVRREVEALLPGLRRHAPDARWVEPDRLHLTLAFLGGVPGERLPSAIEAMEGAAREHRGFVLRVRDAGTFGGRTRPRVLWCGIDAPALAPLQAAVEARLRSAGFAIEERPFTPHLTLARARDAHGDAGLRAAADALHGRGLGEARIDGLELVESHLSPGGSRYEVRAVAPLG